MEKQTENGLLDDGERGGEVVMYGNSNMETYITICKLVSQREFADSSGNSNRGCVSTLGGGMGSELGGRFKREGIYVSLWLIHVEV